MAGLDREESAVREDGAAARRSVRAHHGQAAAELQQRVPVARRRGQPPPPERLVRGGRLRDSCWADFSPLSSCRSPQTALNCSYRSDRVTRD